MSMESLSKSQVSRLCGEVEPRGSPVMDERVNSFLDQPIEGDWPTSGWTPPASKSGATTTSPCDHFVVRSRWL